MRQRDHAGIIPTLVRLGTQRPEGIRRPSTAAQRQPWFPRASVEIGLVALALVLAVLFPITSGPVQAGDPSVTISTGPNGRGLTDRDPINMGTGEYYFLQDVLSLGGPLPLDFRLYYGSQVDSKRFHDGLPFRFVGNRRGTLTVYDFLDPAVAYVELGLGNEIAFAARGEQWEVSALHATRYQLTETSSAFYMIDPIASLVYTFLPTPTVTTLSTRIFTVTSAVNDGSAYPPLGNSESWGPTFSGDGRSLAFASYASNLVSNDTNGSGDVFVRDLLTGQLSRVSVSSTGQQANMTSEAPSLSADGRYVAFLSFASNLVAGQLGNPGVYVHDRQTGTTTRVDVSLAGVGGNGPASQPRISGDGRYVAFASSASNLVGGATGQQHVFLHDRQTGETRLASVSDAGVAGDGLSASPSISADGRYVAFQSFATNLVFPDGNAAYDVFVHDRQLGQTRRVSLSSTGAEANGPSNNPALSADGRYVAFDSAATNLVTGDTNQMRDVFVHDRQTGQTTRVSRSSGGTAGNGDSRNPALSADGRYVAFESTASNLFLGNDSNNAADVFLHDRTSGETVLVSMIVSDRFGPTPGNAAASAPAVSGSGRLVAFQSGATNWGYNDTNGKDDVFVARRSGFGQAFLVRVEDRNGNTLTYTNPSNIDQQGPTRVSDGLGRALSFTYATVGVTDTRPFLTKVEDQTGRAWTFSYENVPADNPGRVTLRSIADPLGNTTTFRYAGAGTNDLMVAKVQPLGNRPYTQTYNPTYSAIRGVVATQTDALGYTTVITARFYEAYTGIFSWFEAQSPDGTKRSYSHIHGGRVAEWLRDESNRTIRFSSEEVADRITGVVDRTGLTTTVGYDTASGRLNRVTNARGDATVFTYTQQAQAFTNPDSGEQITGTFPVLTGIGYPDGTTEAFTYDARGNRLTWTDRAGNTWTFTYDSRGQVLTATNPAGGVTTFTYNADGTLASRADSDTGTTTFGYDAVKRVNRVTHPDGSAIQVVYDALDRITSITDENGRTTAFSYDANGNRTQVTDAAGNQRRLSYDALDRLVGVTDRVSQTTTIGYDSMERTSAITDAASVAVQLGYEARGWLDRVTRGTSTWRIGYDVEGVPVSRTTPLGRTSRQQTDALGLLTAITNTLGNATAVTRDALSRPTLVTDPLNRATAYSYDGRGLLTGVARPISGTAAYQRDSLGQLKRLTDLNGQEWTFGYTAMGRLRTVGDPTGRMITNTYDSRGRLVGATYPDGVAATVSYDAVGNVTRRQYTDGTDLPYSYDALDRLVATTGLTLTYDAEGRVTSTADGATSFGASYDGAGRLQTAVYHNGAFTVTYTYSPTTGLLMSVADSLAGGRVDFVYNADFRLTGLFRANGVATALSWDDADRLTRIQDGSFLDLQYALDAAGQVTGVVLTAPLDPAGALAGESLTLGYDAASQVSGGGYSSDARGRLTAARGQTYGWDGASRLTAAGGVTLTYNGLGDVRTRTAGSSTTQYYYQAAIGLRPVVAERDQASGQVLRYYVWTPDGRLLYGIDAANGNKVFYYHFDRTGSALALTDGSGAVTDAYAYTPYGRLLGRTGTNGQPFTFVGRWGVRQEGTSGTLYQMRARYYDAVAGRFLSREPLWPVLQDPALLNPYQYAGNEPVRRIDPSGLFDPDEAGRLFGEGLYELMQGDRARAAVFVQRYEELMDDRRGLVTRISNLEVDIRGNEWMIRAREADIARFGSDPSHSGSPSELEMLHEALSYLRTKQQENRPLLEQARRDLEGVEARLWALLRNPQAVVAPPPEREPVRSNRQAPNKLPGQTRPVTFWDLSADIADPTQRVTFWDLSSDPLGE